MLEGLKNAVERGKTNLIMLFIGGIVGAGLTLWLTRRGKGVAGLPATPRPRPLPRARPTPPPPPSDMSGMGEHMGNPARYVTTNLDDEIDDPDIDFEGAGEF